MNPGCLILETGDIFTGSFFGSQAQAGELVFNTSHSGYEEIATDPSYYNQILIMTNPLQGNYSTHSDFWESQKIWIKSLVCLEIQNSLRDKSWLSQLQDHNVPVLSSVDTRSLVLNLRKHGTLWAAVLPVSKNSKQEAFDLIKKTKCTQQDWTQKVCITSPKEFQGDKAQGPKLALIDFGYKKNILREMLKRSQKVCVFPSYSKLQSLIEYQPDGVILSNGPGDPKNVIDGTRLVKQLVSRVPLFGICMGHQILAQAMGAKTYKLKFGHRGSNHPIQDHLLNKIYISTQNHGYAVEKASLPKDLQLSHTNLNDNTVAGVYSKTQHCLGVQFHPEHCPGPKEASSLFDFFTNEMIAPFANQSTKNHNKLRLL